MMFLMTFMLPSAWILKGLSAAVIIVVLCLGALGIQHLDIAAEASEQTLPEEVKARAHLIEFEKRESCVLGVADLLQGWSAVLSSVGRVQGADDSPGYIRTFNTICAQVVARKTQTVWSLIRPGTASLLEQALLPWVRWSARL